MENGPDNQRLSNYHIEMKAIRRKLKKPEVPDGKKERLQYRLQLLENVLVPREYAVP